MMKTVLPGGWLIIVRKENRNLNWVRTPGSHRLSTTSFTLIPALRSHRFYHFVNIDKCILPQPDLMQQGIQTHHAINLQHRESSLCVPHPANRLTCLTQKNRPLVLRGQRLQRVAGREDRKPGWMGVWGVQRDHNWINAWGTCFSSGFPLFRWCSVQEKRSISMKSAEIIQNRVNTMWNSQKTRKIWRKTFP